MTQNRSIATTQRILKSTAIPTKTVEARKAWLRMDEKFTRLPMHFKVGSDKLPSITDELELKKRWILKLVILILGASKIILRENKGCRDSKS